MKKATQTNRVLNYLVTYGSITQLEAYQNFGTFSLGKIICNLRRKGYKIKTVRTTGLNRFGEKVHFGRYIYNVCEEAPFPKCNNAEGCEWCEYGENKCIE